ncbi:hypothetical protein [Brevibacterium sp. CFH 10365]|uniref:hypothetical protein n=1 Tax=Brevibacterium sp. CFH 10365 TaxID=2585207 RepID=UPI0012667FCF|nr:hypothetical protein [Brevibacterium sp. CFH 10365]
MSSIIIDTTTGLPELPEGEVWQVEESPGFTLDRSEGWYVSILGPERKPEWSDWEEDWLQDYPSAVRHESSTTQVRHVPIGRTWYGRKKARREVRYLRQPVSRTRWVQRIRFEGEYPTTRDVKVAAIKAVRDRAKRAEASQLIGLYPPNTIGESND